MPIQDISANINRCQYRTYQQISNNVVKLKSNTKVQQQKSQKVYLDKFQSLETHLQPVVRFTRNKYSIMSLLSLVCEIPRTFERSSSPFKFSNARFFYPYKQRKSFRTRPCFVRQRCKICNAKTLGFLRLSFCN